MAREKKNLTEGNIKRQLAELTWPMLLGMMGMVIFNLVDTFFVGKLGVHELAAMSFSFPVVMFIGSLSQGVGIGTSSLISRNVIHTDHKNITMMASRAILLGVLIVLFFMVLGLVTIRPVFTALGAKKEVLDYVCDYMRIWYFGLPFVVVPMVGNNVVRATGDTFTPGMIMIIISVINAVLDPLLIFGIGPFPEMGIRGAALATVIARGSALVAILFVLMKREKLLTLRFGYITDILSTWKSVFYIAGPASLTMLITPLSAGFITRILAGFGKEAVAGFGVASRVEMFALMVIVALGSVLIIFVGQNFSSHAYKRIQEGLSTSFTFSLIWGAFIYLLLFLTGEAVASLFTGDPVVIGITVKYFHIIGASYGFQGLVIVSASHFNGLNRPYPATLFSFVRMILLYAPLAWIGSRLFGVPGVFGAGFIANVAAGALSYRYLSGTIRKIDSAHS